MLAAGVTSTASLLTVLLGASIGGFGTVVATWYATRRTKTGSVRSSEASDLWEAMEAHTQTVSDLADSERRRVDELNKRVDTLVHSNTGLVAKLESAQILGERLREERAALARQATSLARDVERLTAANAHLQRLNEALNERVTHLTDLLEHHDIDDPGGTV